MFQGLEPGVGVVRISTTEEPGVHLFRLGLRCGRDRERGRYLPGRRLGPRHGGMKGERPLPCLSFRLQKIDQGGPLCPIRSIPGLRERAGIDRLAQDERPHVLFTRGCYPDKTLLALPKGNTAKF